MSGVQCTQYTAIASRVRECDVNITPVILKMLCMVLLNFSGLIDAVTLHHSTRIGDDVMRLRLSRLQWFFTKSSKRPRKCILGLYSPALRLCNHCLQKLCFNIEANYTLNSYRIRMVLTDILFSVIFRW